MIDGCWANATGQLQGNYQGNAPFLISPHAALLNVTGIKVTYAAGITGSCNDDTLGDISAVQDAASAADVIMYFGGIDTTVEAEGNDRTEISWLPNSIAILETLATYEKPLVVFQVRILPSSQRYCC